MSNADVIKTACATLNPFQMLNQIAKSNNRKLITARCMVSTQY